MPSRILIFANKAWEVEPLVGVFRSVEARPPNFPEPDALPQVTVPLSDGVSKTVRVRLAYKSAKAIAEVW